MRVFLETNSGFVEQPGGGGEDMTGQGRRECGVAEDDDARVICLRRIGGRKNLCGSGIERSSEDGNEEYQKEENDELHCEGVFFFERER